MPEAVHIKRFLVFEGDQWDDARGWESYRASYDSLEEAEQAAEKMCGQWKEIVDLKVCKVVRKAWGYRPLEPVE